MNAGSKFHLGVGDRGRVGEREIWTEMAEHRLRESDALPFLSLSRLSSLSLLSSSHLSLPSLRAERQRPQDGVRVDASAGQVCISVQQHVWTGVGRIFGKAEAGEPDEWTGQVVLREREPRAVWEEGGSMCGMFGFPPSPLVLLLPS
jgi:hypothetical protein